MNKESKVFLILVSSLVIVLAGCATTRQDNTLEAQALKNKVSLLENELQAKNEEIVSLRDALNQVGEEKTAMLRKSGGQKPIEELKSRPRIEQVQVALKNAGYNPGNLDGRMGRLTREAIRGFQKDNGLEVDGRVGSKTWEALSKYLDKKVK